jgi:hypothetical protein
MCIDVYIDKKLVFTNCHELQNQTFNSTQNASNATNVINKTVETPSPAIEDILNNFRSPSIAVNEHTITAPSFNNFNMSLINNTPSSKYPENEIYRNIANNTFPVVMFLFSLVAAVCLCFGVYCCKRSGKVSPTPCRRKLKLPIQQTESLHKKVDEVGKKLRDAPMQVSQIEEKSVLGQGSSKQSTGKAKRENAPAVPKRKHFPRGTNRPPALPKAKRPPLVPRGTRPRVPRRLPPILKNVDKEEKKSNAMFML